MKKNVKAAAFAAVAAAAAGGLALLVKKILEKRKWEQWDDGTIELSMTAGDMGETEENAAETNGEKAGTYGGEPSVVSVLPSGPKTPRVRPTEEEEREQLRKKLEKIIRF